MFTDKQVQTRARPHFQSPSAFEGIVTITTIPHVNDALFLTLGDKGAVPYETSRVNPGIHELREEHTGRVIGLFIIPGKVSPQTVQMRFQGRFTMID